MDHRGVDLGRVCPPRRNRIFDAEAEAHGRPGDDDRDASPHDHHRASDDHASHDHDHSAPGNHQQCTTPDELAGFATTTARCGCR